jgi:hypothetical protein
MVARISVEELLGVTAIMPTGGQRAATCQG